MASRLKLRGIFPSSRSLRQPPPSLHGVPWGGFPRLTSTMQRLRLLASPPRFVAFARRFHPLRPRFAAARSGRCPGRPRTVVSAVPLPHPQGWRGRALPGSWVTLSCMPRSSTPPDRNGSCHREPPDAAFRSENGVGSEFSFLPWLYHAACMIPVYASCPGSPLIHATLGSGW